MVRSTRGGSRASRGWVEGLTPDLAAARGQAVLRLLEGRWKLSIIFHLFDKDVLRFSQLERAIAGVSQKMLVQQLRELERDGIVARTAYLQVPVRVDYSLTSWGRKIRPAFSGLLEWQSDHSQPEG